MSVPTGVDANAADVFDATVAVKAGRTANARFTIRLVIQNTTPNQVSVNAYLAVDGTLIRALPLVYGPNSQLCLEFTGRAIGLAGGTHSLQLYIGTTAASGVNWVTVDGEWELFYA